jgi:UPF0288 family protein (methanogenesis marker protein 3)
MLVINKKELYENSLAAGEGALYIYKKSRKSLNESNNIAKIAAIRELLDDNNNFNRETARLNKDRIQTTGEALEAANPYKGAGATEANVFMGQKASNSLLNNDVKSGSVLPTMV